MRDCQTVISRDGLGEHSAIVICHSPTFRALTIMEPTLLPFEVHVILCRDHWRQIRQHCPPDAIEGPLDDGLTPEELAR